MELPGLDHVGHAHGMWQVPCTLQRVRTRPKRAARLPRLSKFVTHLVPYGRREGLEAAACGRIDPGIRLSQPESRDPVRDPPRRIERHVTDE